MITINAESRCWIYSIRWTGPRVVFLKFWKNRWETKFDLKRFPIFGFQRYIIGKIL